MGFWGGVVLGVGVVVVVVGVVWLCEFWGGCFGFWAWYTSSVFVFCVSLLLLLAVAGLTSTSSLFVFNFPFFLFSVRLPRIVRHVHEHCRMCSLDATAGGPLYT